MLQSSLKKQKNIWQLYMFLDIDFATLLSCPVCISRIITNSVSIYDKNMRYCEIIALPSYTWSNFIWSRRKDFGMCQVIKSTGTLLKMQDKI